MNKTDPRETHDDEIDLKEVFRVIVRYKVSIILITLILLIASAIFAYYKPNVYASSATVEVLDDNTKGSNAQDAMLKAFGQNSANMDNVIAIFQSRYIVQKALETLNLSTRYYSINALGKKTELYKDSPFVVTSQVLDNAMYGKTFIIEPKDDTHFLLKIKQPSMWSIQGILIKLGLKKLRADQKITYEQVHKYNEHIQTPWFTFTVSNLEKLTAPKYTFSFTPKYAYYDSYIGGLNVALVSEYSSIVKLDYQDDVSLRAKEILNAIAHMYIHESIKEKTKSAQLTLGFIDSQLEKINSKLSVSEQNLQNYKVKNNVVSIAGKVALSSETVSKYEAEELNIQTEINILTNLQHFMNTHKDLNGLTLGTAKFTNPSLLKLIQNLQRMTDKKNLLLVDYTAIHPEVIKLTRSIASTKSAIKSAVESSLRQLTQRSRDIKATLVKYRKSIRALPGQEKSLAELSRPLKVNESVYEYLLQKKAETAILKSSTIANARIVDKALEDATPIKPKRKLIIIVGFILGLIIGIAQAFLREFMITTVRTVEDVEKLTSLPLYGVIPFTKDKMSKNIYEEAFRNIRTNLQFLPGHKENKIIAITSSVSGEGKTTIAAGLAKVLAQSNKKVIVLDLDMRKASIHKQFDLNNNIGVSNYLTSQNTLEEVIKQTDVYGLNIMTTGPLPPNPSELILSKEFISLLEELKNHYDYIVMDTPPAGLVTDATILMNYSDITFAIVRANYSRKEFVKNIDRMAREHSHNRVGVILNAAMIGKEYGYGYGASYAYGYGNSQYYKDRG